jgi:hypothetical protein
MRSFVRLPAALLALFVLSACGSSGGNGPNGTTPRGAYPAGPYGTGEGTVIEPLGFLLPDGMPRTLEDVWKDESKKIILATTSAGWCTACIEEQPALKRFQETYGESGLFILVALFEDASYNAATSELAASWQRQYALPFDVVADTDFKLGRYYNRELTPMNMLVDVNEMKILRISTGFDENATEAILSARLR